MLVNAMSDRDDVLVAQRRARRGRQLHPQTPKHIRQTSQKHIETSARSESPDNRFPHDRGQGQVGPDLL